MVREATSSVAEMATSFTNTPGAVEIRLVFRPKETEAVAAPCRLMATEATALRHRVVMEQHRRLRPENSVREGLVVPAFPPAGRMEAPSLAALI